MKAQASIRRTAALLAIAVLGSAAAGCGTDVISRLLPPGPSASGTGSMADPQTGSDGGPDVGPDGGLDTWPARADGTSSDGGDGTDGAATATNSAPRRRRVRVYRIGPSTYLITNEPWPPQAADRDPGATATEGADP